MPSSRPPKRSALPRAALDQRLQARILRMRDELDAVLLELRGESGPQWDWCGEHADLLCRVYSRAATIETVGYDPGEIGG